MISVPQAFDMAWKHYQAGRLQQAEQLCRQIVQADASHVDALYLLGLIAARTGRDDLAVDYLNAALRLKPDFAERRMSWASCWLTSGSWRRPWAASGRQCAEPDHAVAHSNLGNALREQGELDAAAPASG